MARDFGDMVTSHVGHYTVGFVKLGEDRGFPMGSATPIRFGRISGFLTCAHVAAEIMQLDVIGVVCFPAASSGGLQSRKLKPADVFPVQLGSSPWTERGPDLAFLRVPLDFINELESEASIADAERHRSRWLAGEPEAEIVEVVAGVVGEWTANPRIEGVRSTTPFRVLLHPGKVVEVMQSAPLDVLRFRPIPEEGFELPSRYSGMSGGGLWRLYLRKEGEDRYTLLERRLAGVAFYETSDRDILCHGRTALFDMLFRTIHTEFPDA